MTGTEMQIAIAEFCGWKINRVDHPDLRRQFVYHVINPKGNSILYKWTTEGECESESWAARGPIEYHSSFTFPDNISAVAHKLPDYLHDLNAMREALSKLSSGQYRQFLVHKATIVLKGVFSVASTFYLSEIEELNKALLSADAEAFLRTVGKWKD